jgi:uncharacterized protein YhaN
MSNWIDKLNASNKKRIRQRIEKLQQEKNQYHREYADRPWDIYQKAIESREEEIEQLQALANPKDMLRELEDFKDECKRLRKILAKVNYLAETVDPSNEIGFNNLKRLIGMTNSFTDEYVDEEFKAKAKAGTW